MAWLRKVRVIVRSPRSLSRDAWSWRETEIQDLHLDFDVMRSRVFNDNSAKITVFNARESTRNFILCRGCNILIYAGYEDSGDGLIFQGNIVQSTSAHVGSEWVTTMQARMIRSLNHPFSVTPVTFSFPPGTPVSRAVDAVGGVLGLVSVGLDSLDGITLKNGWVYAGMVSGAFEYLGQILKNSGFHLFVDLGELIIYSTQGNSTYSTTYLSYESGLYTFQDVTDYSQLMQKTIDDLSKTKHKTVTVVKNGVKKKKKILVTGATKDVYAELEAASQQLPKVYEATAIMLPKLRPNGLVHIVTDTVDTLLVAHSLNIKGNSYGEGDFGMGMSLMES